jgi:hypothetical protein
VNDFVFPVYPDVPILSPVVAQLFRASSYSLNSETAGFRLRRTIPITIFVDGDYEHIGTVAADLKDRAIEILASSGYKLVGQWGPHEGSNLITLFGQGREPERGSSLLEETFPELSERFRALSRYIPEAARDAIRVVFIVGTQAIGLLGVVGALPATIPVIVLEGVACCFGGISAIGEVRHVLGLNGYGPKIKFDEGF